MEDNSCFFQQKIETFVVDELTLEWKMNVCIKFTFGSFFGKIQILYAHWEERIKPFA